MKYQLVTARSPEDLATKVELLYIDGWRLEGTAIIVGTELGRQHFYQAMTKFTIV